MKLTPKTSLIQKGNYHIIDLNFIHMIDEINKNYHIAKVNKVDISKIRREIEALKIPSDMLKTKSLVKEYMKNKMCEIIFQHRLWEEIK